MKIEVHLIQNFAPSCLNRDDTNTPKDCEFGGVRRARISSQCFKRAMREHFRASAVVPVGERTKLFKKILTEQLSDLSSSDELSPALDAFLETYYSKMDGKAPDSTAVLLFLSPREVEVAVQAVRDHWEEKLKPMGAGRLRYKQLIADGTKAEEAKKKAKIPEYKADNDVKKALKNAAHSADIALFGRMLAEQTSLNVDAACQVAQAISTHAVNPETDFYSAVDELQKDHSGAGMLGVTGFNSACFYRYALLDFNALQKNVDGDQALARKIAQEFLKAAIKAIPTGKQNSMAAQNPPTLGLFVVREGGMPLSLANAFAAPTQESENGGLVAASVARLSQYWGKLTEVYGAEGITATPWFSLEEKVGGALDASQKTTARGAIDAVLKALPGGGA